MRRGSSNRVTDLTYAVGIPVLIALAIVFTVLDRAWFFVALFVLVGLAWGVFYLVTGNVMRVVDAIARDAPPIEPTEAMLAVEALDEAIGRARTVPLTDQVRLDPETIDGLLARLRAAVPWESSDVRAIVDELDELIRRAKPIPLTTEIRIDRDEVYDRLDRMRASLAEQPER